MTCDICVLTTRDLLILRDMLDRRCGGADPLAGLLRRKIDAARIVFGNDLPEDVATLGSRIVFRMGGALPDTRILCTEEATHPDGMHLSVGTQRGLALLGLAEGQEMQLTAWDGGLETIRLECVLYQPDLARRLRA